MATPREVLIEAKALCTPEAWRQGDDTRYPGKRCAATAIVEASHGSKVFLRHSVDAIFRRAINELSITRWNDAPGRTLADVHAAFDRAIAACEP